MTPREMLEKLDRAGLPAESWQTGGGCGAIGLEVQRHAAHVLVTPDHGPYAYALEEDTDQGDGWRVALFDTDDGGTWIDGDLTRDGDAITPAARVPAAVARLIGHHLDRLATA